MGEPAAILNDLEATLFSYAINNGDFLLLEQGAVLGKVQYMCMYLYFQIDALYLKVTGLCLTT